MRTLADVFTYAAAEHITLRLDGAEVRVRRPALADRAPRRSSPSMPEPSTQMIFTVVTPPGSGRGRRPAMLTLDTHVTDGEIVVTLCGDLDLPPRDM